MNLSEKFSQIISLLAYCKRVLKQLPYYKFSGIKAVLLGYTPNKTVLYPDLFSKRKFYITDFERYVLTPFINIKYKVLFNNKLANYYFLSRYSDKVCPVLYYIDYDGKIMNISKDNNIEKYVYKPNNGWGGKGIKIDNKIGVQGQKNYIIVPYIKNHQYAKNIFSKSLNTIRLLTCVVDDEIHVISSVHRFGTENTKGVDNFTGGGISALINVEKGIIESAVSFRNTKKYSVSNHPDTGVNIVGTKIPMWSEVVKDTKCLHSKISFIKYIGWDIAITDSSYVIIEANHVSDLDLLQCHGGILVNEKTTKFYKKVL